MSTRALRVVELALEADADLDEVLVALWDVGLDYLDSPSSVVFGRDVRTARRALALDDNREQRTVAYWMQRSGLSRDELARRLADLGVRLTPDVRRIPKGSLRHLRALFADSPTVASTVGANVEQLNEEQLAPLRWETQGSTPVGRYLTADDVLAIHEALEEDFRDSGDPISPPGVKEPLLLDSAVFRPQTSLGGVLKYESAEMAAAALFHSVVLNHAFFNGNKRTGLVALIAFLDMHKLVLTCSRDELFRLTLRVASHGLVPAGADNLPDREVLEIARWIKGNTRVVDRQERPMKWLKLRKRLRELGCECTPAHGVGNRINISRTVVERRSVLRRATAQPLSTQVAWAGDGTDADRNTIHKIRADLRLDDAHGYDGAAFYDDAVVDTFIAEYRDILRRLSKL